MLEKEVDGRDGYPSEEEWERARNFGRLYYGEGNFDVFVMRDLDGKYKMVYTNERKK